MRTRRLGPHAVLVEVAGPDQALALALFARDAAAGAVEVVPAATTVLFDGVADVPALERLLERWRPAATAPTGDLVELPTTYDGADLDAVARRWGTDRDGVVARHQAVDFVASFCGFAPGFAYLRGLPDALAVPRLDVPRTRVPAGAVALADTWCAVYPTASPGGWQLIGHTDVRLWDASAAVPALLAPGTRVRFTSA